MKTKFLKKIESYFFGFFILALLLLALTGLMRLSISMIESGDDGMVGAFIFFMGLAVLILSTMITVAHFFKSE